MNNMPSIFFDGTNTTKILVISTTTLSSITNWYNVTFSAVFHLNQRQDSNVGNTTLFKSPIAAGYNSMHVCIVSKAGLSTTKILVIRVSIMSTYVTSSVYVSIT